MKSEPRFFLKRFTLESRIIIPEKNAKEMIWGEKANYGVNYLHMR